MVAKVPIYHFCIEIVSYHAHFGNAMKYLLGYFNVFILLILMINYVYKNK